jgi:sugar/nucleoside kinase (ribokinase family)
VTIDVPHDSEIVPHAAALVVSEEYAAHQLDDRESAQTFAAYAERCEGLVILTRGDKPMMYGRAGAAARFHEPFPIDAVDTAGAGDGFRAGIIYGLLQGLDGAELLTTASAVAALVCARAPGVLNSPTHSELTRFLAATG